MSNKLKDWSTTAASNNSTPPEGWPEGMAPSKVNDTARQNMAYIREWYEDAEWIRYAHTISASDASSVTISGDVTGVYVADRAVRLDQDNAKIGYVSSSSYSAPNTTVNISGITVSSPTIIEVGAIKNEKSLPNDVVGSGSRNLIGYAPGFISGLQMTLAADADHDITVSTGNARADGDDANINLTSAITKQLDAAWAEGTDAGGLPSGVTLAGPEMLYFFAISKTDGTVDAGFDTSSTAANLLSDASTYTYYKMLGVAYTNSSDNIVGVINKSLVGTGSDELEIRASQTFTAPSWAHTLTEVLLVAAGGGGSGNDTGEAGSAGGSTSFDGFTVGGGSGGSVGVSAGVGGPGGTPSSSGITASNFVYISRMQSGGAGASGSGGDGGENGVLSDLSGYPNITGGNAQAAGSNGGGGGAQAASWGGGGGGAAMWLKNYPVSGSITVTVGAGGAGFGTAGDGGDGLVRIKF